MSGTCDDGEIQDLENALEVTNLELIARCAELDTLKQEVERLREQVLVASRVNANLEQRLSEAEAREGMRGLLADVAVFHRACGQPVLDKPTVPSEERVKLRLKLIEEEAQEIYESLGFYFGKDSAECFDLSRVDLVELADGLADLIYICGGTALEFGIPLDRVWQEVQRSNMSKIDPTTGRVERGAAGKIIKGPSYEPPDIAGAIWGDENR